MYQDEKYRIIQLFHNQKKYAAFIYSRNGELLFQALNDLLPTEDEQKLEIDLFKIQKEIEDWKKNKKIESNNHKTEQKPKLEPTRKSKRDRIVISRYSDQVGSQDKEKNYVKKKRPTKKKKEIKEDYSFNRTLLSKVDELSKHTHENEEYKSKIVKLERENEILNLKLEFISKQNEELKNRINNLEGQQNKVTKELMEIVKEKN